MMRIRRADAVEALQLAFGRNFGGGARAAGVMLCALAVAACTTTSDTTGSVARARSPTGVTVAIESVDGAPHPIVRQIAQDIGAQAAQRRIAVVERDGEAAYRMRGYLATRADQGGTWIVWAWDVYDSSQHRVFRLRGEDKASAPGQSWSAADDQTLRRIVNASLEQLAGFLAGRGIPS
jgi:hypothetical protein